MSAVPIENGEFLDGSGQRVSVHEHEAESEDQPEKFYFVCLDGQVFRTKMSHQEMRELVERLRPR